MQILDDALDAVGKTPLIRLDKIAQLHGLKCNLRKLSVRFWRLACLPICVVQWEKPSSFLLGVRWKIGSRKLWWRQLRRTGPWFQVEASLLSLHQAIQVHSILRLQCMSLIHLYAGIGLALACAVKVIYTYNIFETWMVVLNYRWGVSSDYHPAYKNVTRERGNIMRAWGHSRPNAYSSLGFARKFDKLRVELN